MTGQIVVGNKANLQAFRSIQLQVTCSDDRIRAELRTGGSLADCQRELGFRSGLLEGARHMGFMSDDFTHAVWDSESESSTQGGGEPKIHKGRWK